VHRSRLTAKLGVKKPEDLKKLIKISPSSLDGKEVVLNLPTSSDDQDLLTKT
jgi:hypothetical protein